MFSGSRQGPKKQILITYHHTEIQSQIRQIIQQNRVESTGEKSYHFTDGKMIKRLYISKEIANALSKGEIGIVK